MSRSVERVSLSGTVLTDVDIVASISITTRTHADEGEPRASSTRARRASPARARAAISSTGASCSRRSLPPGLLPPDATRSRQPRSTCARQLLRSRAMTMESIHDEVRIDAAAPRPPAANSGGCSGDRDDRRGAVLRAGALPEASRRRGLASARLRQPDGGRRSSREASGSSTSGSGGGIDVLLSARASGSRRGARDRPRHDRRDARPRPAQRRGRPARRTSSSSRATSRRSRCRPTPSTS